MNCLVCGDAHAMCEGKFQVPDALRNPEFLKVGKGQTHFIAYMDPAFLGSAPSSSWWS
jgi:hypothetical protein